MEIGVACDGVVILEEMTASRGNCSIEIVNGSEVFVGEGFIDERPKVLGGLQFRAAGRLIDEPDAIGDRQVLRAVPTGIVELKDDDAIVAGASLTRERFEQLCKEGFVDAVRQVPDGLSA